MSIIAKDSTDSDKLTVFAKGTRRAVELLHAHPRWVVRSVSSPKAIASRFSPPSNVSSEAYRTLGEACRPLETGSLADVPV